jgi:hypothetical protein
MMVLISINILLMDKIFGQRRICDRRKLRNVASALKNNALAWWRHLCEFDKLPKTWNNVKILMRKTFVDSSLASNLNFEIYSLEEEATIASHLCIIFCRKSWSNKRRNM